MRQVLVVLLLLFSQNAFPQDLMDFSIEGHPYDNQVVFQNGKAVITFGIDQEFRESHYEYKISKNDVFTSITLSNGADIQNFTLLSNPLINILIDDKNNLFAWGLNTIYKNPKYRLFDIFESISLGLYGREYRASSFLTEGKTQYIPGNLEVLSGKKPWVEGVPGDGIGEIITIDATHEEAAISSLLISIGYVDVTKPHLYTQNPRPKKILVTDLHGKNEHTFTLTDTPNIQTFPLNGINRGVQIKILEVYKGTKFDDLCINFIIAPIEMDYFGNR